MRSLSSGRIIKSPPVRKDFRLLHSPDPAKILSRYLEERAEPEKEEAPKEDENSAETGQREERDFQAEAEKILAEAEATLARARAEAAALLEKARAEADELRKKAEEEREKARQEAYNAGFNEGLAAGRKEAQAEYEEKLNEAQRLRDEAAEESVRIRQRAEEERAERIRQSEQEILKLAVEIAEKIIAGKIKESPAAWMGKVKAMVEKVAGAKELILRVAPEDKGFLLQRLEEVKTLLTESPPIKVVGDASLKKGDLVIQSDLGQLDGRIKEQLQKIAGALQEEAMAK